MDVKQLFKGERLSINSTTINGKDIEYVKDESSDGKFIIVLPYKNRFGKVDFLLRRELIPLWDEHSDICAIQIPYTDDYLHDIIKVVESDAGCIVTEKDIRDIGVSQESRISGNIYYIYAVDLSTYIKHEEDRNLENYKTFWGGKKEVVQSIDPYLSIAYIRAMDML